MAVLFLAAACTAAVPVLAAACTAAVPVLAAACTVALPVLAAVAFDKYIAFSFSHRMILLSQ